VVATVDQHLFLSRLSKRSKPQGVLWAFEAYRVPILASGPEHGRYRARSVVTDVQWYPVEPRTIRSRVRAFSYSIGCNRRPELSSSYLRRSNCRSHGTDQTAVLTAPRRQPFPRLLDDSRFHGSRTPAVSTAPGRQPFPRLLDNNRFHGSRTSAVATTSGITAVFTALGTTAVFTAPGTNKVPPSRPHFLAVLLPRRQHPRSPTEPTVSSAPRHASPYSLAVLW